MRQRRSTIITLTITLTLLFLGVPVIALAQTPASLTLNPTSITGGTEVTGQVSLSGPAPEGGRGVLLSSSNTAVATVPASVRVPAGQTTVSFAVTTIPVAQSSTVTISAGTAGLHHAALTVVPPVLSSVTGSLTPSSITGGDKSARKAYLSGPAPAGGFVINLSSSNTAVATVPASITALPGPMSPGFMVTTFPVAQSTAVTITATAGGVTKTVQLNVVPLVVELSFVGLSPTTIVGGHGVNGQVALNGPAPSGGLAVQLSSSNAVATVPASVTVAANRTTEFFTVTTVQIAQPIADTTITATAGGGTKTAKLTILRSPLSRDCVACEKFCEVAGAAENNPGAVAGCKAACKKICG